MHFAAWSKPPRAESGRFRFLRRTMMRSLEFAESASVIRSMRARTFFCSPKRIVPTSILARDYLTQF